MIMKFLAKSLHVILIVFTSFLALTAVLGGLVLFTGFYAPPLDMLQGSLFNDYTVPALSLTVMVGGSAIFAAVLLFRRSKFDMLFATTAGIIIMCFEFVEMLVIGSPAGPARFMQVFYFGLGISIVIAALGTWFLDLRSS